MQCAARSSMTSSAGRSVCDHRVHTSGCRSSASDLLPAAWRRRRGSRISRTSIAGRSRTRSASLSRRAKTSKKGWRGCGPAVLRLMRGGDNINEAYNMDCLDAMRQMPDKAFDLAIVDPPYGGGAGSQFVQVERESRTDGARRRARGLRAPQTLALRRLV